jgi:ABC-type nitrate/sulfonate/bicarbonate transport system substrate-binding protein
MILGFVFTATFPLQTISPAVGIGVRSMTAIFIILLTTLVPLTEAHAADKIRISISNLSGQFMTFPLAHKRGFLKEEGTEAEIIRVTGGAGSAALSSGDLDYGTGMALGGSISGLPVKVVACFVPAPVFALLRGPRSNQSRSLKARRSEFPCLVVYPFLARGL